MADTTGVYSKDREITLGTTMILGIFFALAVFAAVFFGFGYSMGAKHIAAAGAAPIINSSVPFNSFKPAPGNPKFGAPGKPAPILEPTPAYAPTAPPAKPSPKATPEAFVEPTVANTAPTTPGVPAVKPIPRSALAANVPVPIPVTASPAAGGPASVVQVAAVSHQEDADLLVTTLKRRGYAVAIHSEPQDKLLHIQIGPFANRADANAMRQRLLADGFNAIVK